MAQRTPAYSSAPPPSPRARALSSARVRVALFEQRRFLYAPLEVMAADLGSRVGKGARVIRLRYVFDGPVVAPEVGRGEVMRAVARLVRTEGSGGERFGEKLRREMLADSFASRTSSRFRGTKELGRALADALESLGIEGLAASGRKWAAAFREPENVVVVAALDLEDEDRNFAHLLVHHELEQEILLVSCATAGGTPLSS
jgi:hypothetical protein